MSSKPDLLDRAVVIPSSGDHKRTVIFLHGLGDEGASFVDVFQMLALPQTKVVLPNAPRKPVTCNGGYVMPAWYDIASLGSDRSLADKQDETGIKETSDRLLTLIKHEVQQVGAKNVFIGGFSQGASISVYTALRADVTLGGVVGLSGYALLAHHGSAHVTDACKQTPVFIYHGVADEVVPVAFARESHKFYQAAGLHNLEYIEEPRLGHSLSRDEIFKIKQFLDKNMQ